MNYSAIRESSLLGRILRFPLRFIPPEMVIPILQGKLRGKKWIVGSSNHGCWLGSYEYQKRIVFEKTIKPGSIVFDIGAHVGFYTLLSSLIVGVKGKVFAFEPLPRNLYYMKKHLHLNRVINVTVIEAAVTDRCGISNFQMAPNSYMGHISEEGGLQVRMVSLDELISGGELPIPNYLKIDVEESEMLVLYGAKAMLTTSHPTLFLSTHSPDIHQQCCEFLESLDFKLSPVIGDNINTTDEVLACSKS
jgi:FkbM family methyltransferase